MRTILSILILGIFIQCIGQPTDIPWQTCFGTEGSEKDTPKCIEKTKRGYLVGIGLSNYAPHLPHYHAKGEGWIISIDSLGNKIWERCYGGSEGDGIEKIISINDTSFFLFGHSNSNDGDIQSNRHGGMWVVKINEHGDILWENTYGGIIISEDPRDALFCPDGGLIMMCRIMGAGGDISEYFGSNDIWVCKIDSIGNIEWEKTLGNHALDNALNMIISSQSTLIIVGGHNESGGMIQCPDMGNYGADAWIVEMDMDGNILRQFCYGGSFSEVIYDIVEIEDGYVFIAWTNSNDQDVSGFHGVAGEEAKYDIWAVKINYKGELIWQRCLGGSYHEIPNSIFVKSDTSVIIFGNANSADGDVSNNHNTTGYFEDIWAIELDLDGNLVWEHCFGGGGNDRFHYAHSVVQNSNNDFVLIAATNYVDGDVNCELVGSRNAWVFQIKDCNNYMPSLPTAPTGPDTLCITTDSTATYKINPAAGAWSYEWQVLPEEAGSITSDSSTATLNWSPGWEGQAQINVRSWNDCGQSDWSEIKTTWSFSCLGIESPSPVPRNPFLHIFPNPASNEIHCQLSAVNCQLSMIIYDLCGRKKDEIMIPKGQTQINLKVSAYSPGVYIVALKDETGFTAMGKFMKH